MRPPGSKSLTNRALVAAALAAGRSQLAGVLDSQDTRVMIASLREMGVAVEHDADSARATVVGCSGRPPATEARLQLENSGTSIRFLTAFCALGNGAFTLDGNDRMRQRPIGDLIDALRRLGVEAECDPASRCPPVSVSAAGISGGETTVAGNISSQFLSALLLAAPAARSAVTIRINGELVSRPYVEMTRQVMRSFGVETACGDGSEQTPADFICRIEPQQYRGCDYAVEPDASAASYFFAAAAVTSGSVTVDGLSAGSLQGDVGFVNLLEQMGCRVDWNADSITVHGGALRGVEVDMNAVSDTAQTLAAVAVFADGSTRIRNIAHVRHKETDRISAVATELRRLGVAVDEFPDGLEIHPPAALQPAVVQTYDDHRMAMSFALIGLKSPGVRIADPDCTAKTYPRFFDDLQKLCDRSR